MSPDRRLVLRLTALPPLTSDDIRPLSAIGYSVQESSVDNELDLVGIGQDAAALILQARAPSAGVMRQLVACRVIALVGTGYDNLDLDAATELGILVTNAPSYASEEVALHAFAMLLAAHRRLVVAHDMVADSEPWDYDQFRPIPRLSECTLGVIGMGRIGAKLVEMASGFSLRVLVHDPYSSDAKIVAAGAVPADLDELLSKSDLVTIHSLLTAETRGLIGAAAFRRMKPTAYLINVSRGAIVDTDALTRALQAGEIAGAALDVTDPEPLPVGHPLLDDPRVLLSPHLGWYSERSLPAAMEEAVEQVVQVLRGERPTALVNPAVLQRPNLRL